MCGIAGIIGLNDCPVADCEVRLKKMGKMIGHRGPDQNGYYISKDSNVCIFNNRLSIVDINAKLKLPMRSLDENYLLSFNGEIYNYKDLYKSLINDGPVFESKTDTEVLFNGLISYGLDYLKYLDGMWGFAFVDQAQKTISLSRDIMGEKPLYYFIGKKELIFCSEISPIIGVMLEDPEWNDEEIVCSFQYRAASPGETLIKKIKRLHGGETLAINYKKNTISRKFYNKLNIEKWKWFFDTNPTTNEVLELYEQEIQSSCNLRFSSEVGFVATLSGGIDSTLINLMLSKKGHQKINAIHGVSSLISPKRGKDLSELEAARYTSSKLGIDLKEFFMYDDDALIIHQEEASDCFDGIFCEGAASFRILAKQARLLGKKVLVLSDGPDELLNGYNVDLRVNEISHRLDKVSNKKRRSIAELALKRSNWSGKSQGLLNWAYLNSTPSATRPNHGGTATNIMSDLISESYKKKAFKKYGVSRNEEFMLYHKLDVLQKISLGYLQSSIPDYVNTRSDRGVMKESIEARLPFLAAPIVELTMSTPNKFRVNKRGEGKSILRELVKNNIGEHISTRGKYGFALPFWMISENADKLRMHDVIKSSPIFDRTVFKSTVKDEIFKQGNERLVWMAYSLAMTEIKFNTLRY